MENDYKEFIDSWNLWETLYIKTKEMEPSEYQFSTSSSSNEMPNIIEDCLCSKKFYNAHGNVPFNTCLSHSTEELRNKNLEVNQINIINITDNNTQNLNKNKFEIINQKNKKNINSMSKNKKVYIQSQKSIENTYYISMPPTFSTLTCSSCVNFESFNFNKAFLCPIIFPAKATKFKSTPLSYSGQKHFQIASNIEVVKFSLEISKIHSIMKNNLSFKKAKTFIAAVKNFQECKSIYSKDQYINFVKVNLQYLESIKCSINNLPFSTVYICTICNLYFENWHFYMHMQDEHKIYVCLFCFGIFDKIQKLTYHLINKHKSKTEFFFKEDFYEFFKSSCYIICCFCERLFLKNTNFSDHICSQKLSTEISSSFNNDSDSKYTKINSKTSNINTSSNSIPLTIRRHSQRVIKPFKQHDVYLYTNLINNKNKRSKQIVEKDITSMLNNPNNACSMKKKIDFSTSKNFKLETAIKYSKIIDNLPFINKNQLDNSFKNNIENIEIDVLPRKYSNGKINTKKIQGPSLLKSNYHKGFKKLKINHLITNKFSETNITQDLYNSFNPNENKTIDIFKKAKRKRHLDYDINEHKSKSSRSHIDDHKSSDILFENEENLNPVTSKDQILNSNQEGSLIIKICTKNNSMFTICNSPNSKTEILKNENFNTCSDKINTDEVSNMKLYDNICDSNDKIIELKKSYGIINDQRSINDNNIKLVSPLNLEDIKIKEMEKKEQRFTHSKELINFDGILLAGEEVSFINVHVDNILDNINIEDLLKCCIKAVESVCVYCNHARHIAVNAKQLSLHMLAEHRFQPQHPAIILHHEQLIFKIKKSLKDLESYYFNLDSYNSKDGTFNISNLKIYECFHCRFCCTVHKELYVHNKKVHQKSILLCIMCKSTFFSYSELLCHLCPGVYAAETHINFRCCLCSVNNISSAFRLMVHLRKKHHTCDVCLESTENQQQLSSHIWKHKLHHICFKCGITYRNKPDITKHLFWKHGTESVLCKKCLQKKWPYIYHFCVPPSVFKCEECGCDFSKAVSLKVHKRIHLGKFLYSCPICSEKFISKKLLSKHNIIHSKSPVSTQNNQISDNNQHFEKIKDLDESNKDIEKVNSISVFPRFSIEKQIEKVDVYDLPPLNLSSESDSESDNRKVIKLKSENLQNLNNQFLKFEPLSTNLKNDIVVEAERDETVQKEEQQIMNNIWDNFKNYSENLEKFDNLNFENQIDSNCKQKKKHIKPKNESVSFQKIVLLDHDYCEISGSRFSNNLGIQLSKTNLKTQINQNLITVDEKISTKVEDGIDNLILKKKVDLSNPTINLTSSSNYSSDSDSSSCSCKTNCSCSSTSANSSSCSSCSNSSKLFSKKLRCLEDDKKKKKNLEETITIDKDAQKIIEKCKYKIEAQLKLEFMESDLDTTESESGEDFYEKFPQQKSNELLTFKNNQEHVSSDSSNIAPIVLANKIGNSHSVQCPLINITPQKKLKKKKQKKSVKKKIKLLQSKNLHKLLILKSEEKNKLGRGKKNNEANYNPTEIKTNIDFIEDSISRVNTIHNFYNQNSEHSERSKRKRIPKRFYGDSSDEELNQEKFCRWHKTEYDSSIINTSARQKWQSLKFASISKEKSKKKMISICSENSQDPLGKYICPDKFNETYDTLNIVNSSPPIYSLVQPLNTIDSRKLYCYCQCPYDEVSEMIACDGDNCIIEWFHFECVGIEMPPKGKWFCPDCLKKSNVEISHLN